jgi:hypothetical protein
VFTPRPSFVHRKPPVLPGPDYDENWGAISPSHAAFVARLDAAGFTVTDEAEADSYWHLLLAIPAQRTPT